MRQREQVYAAFPELAMGKKHVDTCVVAGAEAAYFRFGDHDSYMGLERQHDGTASLTEQGMALLTDNATAVPGIQLSGCILF